MENAGESGPSGISRQRAWELIIAGQELQRELLLSASSQSMDIEEFRQRVDRYFASARREQENDIENARREKELYEYIQEREDRKGLSDLSAQREWKRSAEIVELSSVDDSDIKSILDRLIEAGMIEPDMARTLEGVASSSAIRDFRSPVEIQLAKITDDIAAAGESEASPTPVVLYIDNEGDYAKVRAALEKTLAAFDLKIAAASDPVRGSIWQAFVAVFNRQTTPERIDDAAGILKAGAQARWHGEPQSQITKAQGEAIAALLTALQDNQNALLTFSNILVLKVDGVPVVRELTPEQVEHMQKNPRLYADPRVALGVLDVGLAGVPESGPDDKPQAIAT